MCTNVSRYSFNAAAAAQLTHASQDEYMRPKLMTNIQYVFNLIMCEACSSLPLSEVFALRRAETDKAKLQRHFTGILANIGAYTSNTIVNRCMHRILTSSYTYVWLCRRCESPSSLKRSQSIRLRNATRTFR